MLGNQCSWRARSTLHLSHHSCRFDHNDDDNGDHDDDHGDEDEDTIMLILMIIRLRMIKYSYKFYHNNKRQNDKKICLQTSDPDNKTQFIKTVFLKTSGCRTP